MTTMMFQNPRNGYAERYNPTSARTWCFLFGPFYFIARGNWRHAVISAALAIPTLGLSWLIYPFFVDGINRAHYGRQGFVAVPGQYAGVISSPQFYGDTKPRAPRQPANAMFLIIGFVGALIFQEVIAYGNGRECHRTVYSATHKDGAP